MNEKDQLSELLHRYHQGTCSEEDLKRLELWIAEMERATKDEVTTHTEEKRKELQRSMRDNIMAGLHTQQTVRHRALWPFVIKIAAVFCLVVGAGYYLSRYGVPDSGPDPMVRLWDTIATPKGAIKKITLDDQSTVVLSANSSIRVSNEFSKTNRSIEILSGEAWFDVVRNPSLPFVVKSGKLRTTVLGTQFMVTTHDAFRKIEVNVTRGKVNVADSSQSKNLLPGEAASYDSSTKSLISEALNIAFDPNTQRYAITDCSFSELSARIESIYGYKLIPASAKVRERFYTGEIDLTQSVRMVLTKFLEIHHSRFEISGKEVHIY